MNENEKQQQDGIFSEYANAVYFDATAWDLSMTFGRTVPRTPPQERQQMEWTTAITIPWSQAKLMAYYLLVNLAMHESTNGPVPIPPSSTPVKPQLPMENAPLNAQELQAKIDAIYEKIVLEKW